MYLFTHEGTLAIAHAVDEPGRVAYVRGGTRALMTAERRMRAAPNARQVQLEYLVKEQVLTSDDLTEHNWEIYDARVANWSRQVDAVTTCHGAEALAPP